jgi:hypothetical protein
VSPRSIAQRDARVRIRMYRQPFGDAFLLTFYSASEPHHVLIDCGVLSTVPQATRWTQQIVRDVTYATAGQLDVVVATHMHWDHISGFYDAGHAFASIKTDEVWLPWTEHSSDPRAIKHQRLRTLQLESVRRARRLLDSSRDPRSQKARSAKTTLDRILAFYGPRTDGTGELEAARNALFGFGQAPRFLEKGMQVALAHLPDVHVHILGPARDQSLLGFGEYGRDRGFYGALLAHDDTARNADAEVEMTQPFDARQRWTAEWKRENPLVRHMIESYEDGELSWRRIDDDWLFYATEVAGRLHVGANTLSLALAFELSGSGEVLLFPGDASVSAQDLLPRTVFYKVPNHGSETTVDPAVVEAMTHGDLVAAITADVNVARSLGLEMPSVSVQARLTEKTRGRLLIPQADKLTSIATQASNQSFLERTSVTELYVDYTIPW